MSIGKGDNQHAPVNGSLIARFTLAERLGHWSHAVSFVLLLFTGSGLAFYSFSRLLGPEGLRLFRTIHHIMAYPFTFLTVLILIAGAPGPVIQWLKECLRWSREDFAFIQAFPREFFLLPVKLPPQGKYNAGQKVNSLLCIAGSLLMIVTGWMMLLPDRFTLATLAWAHALHSGGALVLGGVILGHAYLGLLHPHSRESIKGMLTGKVSAGFAASHHAKWYQRPGV
ncbi:Formate dehydrogenase, cytochrome b556(fdo) subunit [Neomoorella glycerini]|uniref:Formate dehydrogenase, cytochrome b556(Fdo) subunit n=1 Tax=Neomoorella glycerini TaxID=55779 RepID=A0A6I5ZMS1_9FIRM|nr:cytochrome b/b6 domain-containing protein [Moorella glycerini]QGP90859.1 Formate dehydrogenase, cytochrome b556(fdo) subunit [Moorella glycerini]